MLTKKLSNNYYLTKLKFQYNKYEKKKYLLRSIIQNQKIKPYVRAYAFYKLIHLNSKISISRQYSVCFETGKIKSQINKFNRSRQITKQYGLVNKLTNINIKSW